MENNEGALNYYKNLTLDDITSYKNVNKYFNMPMLWSRYKILTPEEKILNNITNRYEFIIYRGIQLLENDLSELYDHKILTTNENQHGIFEISQEKIYLHDGIVPFSTLTTIHDNENHYYDKFINFFRYSVKKNERFIILKTHLFYSSKLAGFATEPRAGEKRGNIPDLCTGSENRVVNNDNTVDIFTWGFTNYGKLLFQGIYIEQNVDYNILINPNIHKYLKKYFYCSDCTQRGAGPIFNKDTIINSLKTFFENILELDLTFTNDINHILIDNYEIVKKKNIMIKQLNYNISNLHDELKINKTILQNTVSNNKLLRDLNLNINSRQQNNDPVKYSRNGFILGGYQNNNRVGI